jgi:2-oxo-hept-3-ene-1,7-dioate hydratase
MRAARVLLFAPSRIPPRRNSPLRTLKTMLSPDLITSLARQLYDARKGRTQLRHFSKQHPQMTVEDGYAIQREWVRLEQADGRTIKGRKIGLTSRAMQQAAQITEPDYAPLMDDMFFEQGGDIPVSRFILPRVEVELAFILGRPLRGPGVTLFDVLSATEYVTPAIEIIDARIEQFDRETKQMRKVVDTISDFAANAGIVLGGRPVRPMDVDLRWVGALLSKNGVIEETGLAAGVLNHPATGAAWLANKIAPHGEQLNAGDVVLAGSFTRPVAAQAGDNFHVDYGPLGAVAFRFV